MGCDYPVTAYRSSEFNPETGRYGLTFNPMRSLSGTAFKLPCGRCTGCKLEHSRQWGTRCMHEASLHPENSFLNLTFDREHLPVDYSVHPRHMQLFFKKLRKLIYPKKVRFFLGAEYGDLNQRPHYHVILFNHDFNDKIFYERTDRGDILYTSKTLTNLWGQGFCTLGAVTFASACYTARYAVKKITGLRASEHYLREHPDHHFICRVRSEFSLMSRGDNSGDPIWGGGIGSGWIAKYKDDTYKDDSVIVNEHPTKPPRFYDQKLSEEELHQTQQQRRLKAEDRPKVPRTFNAENARAKVRDARISTLKRKL